MRNRLAVAVGVAALAGCGGSGDDRGDGYPQSAVDAFVRECRKDPSADDATCRCVVERLEVTMPYEEFAAADAALKEDREAAPAALAKLRAAVDDCT